jgi:hypothetical protein
MTYFLIVLLSAAVWNSKGHYDDSAPFLVISFVVWAYARIGRQEWLPSNAASKSELQFKKFFPWAAALMIAVKPNLTYVAASFGTAYFLFRLIPLGLNLVSCKIRPFIFLLFFMTIPFLSPNPFIDVFRSNSMAVAFLRHGLNPYSQTYPRIYGERFDYAPGFLYWPGALLLQTLSKFVFGDIRVVLIVGWWGAAFFFPKTNRHFESLRKLWWVIPFIPFGFEQGWIDPLLSLAAVITLWSMKNKRWWLMAAAIAMAASVKQYGFLIGAFPLAVLALDREWLAFAKVSLTSLFLFLLVLAPFLIWDLHGFIAMTVTAHLLAQPRPDALNFTSFWMRNTRIPFPPLAQLGMALYGFVFAILHLLRNRTKGRLTVIPESWAMAFGFSMMFGKFAFCNYYWLLISFLILSIAFENDTGSALG